MDQGSVFRINQKVWIRGTRIPCIIWNVFLDGTYQLWDDEFDYSSPRSQKKLLKKRFTADQLEIRELYE